MVNAVSANPFPSFYKNEIKDDNQTIFCADLENFLTSSRELAWNVSHVGIQAISGKYAEEKKEQTEQFKVKLYEYQKESPHNAHLRNVEKIVLANEQFLTPETDNTLSLIVMTISLVASAALFILGCAFASVPVFGAIALTAGFAGIIISGIALAILLTNKRNDLEDAEATIKTIDLLWKQKQPILIAVQPKVEVEPTYPISVLPVINTPTVLVAQPNHHHSHIPHHKPIYMPGSAELHEIPGSGKNNPVRDVAASLSNVGIAVAHKPDLVATAKIQSHHGHKQSDNIVVPGPNPHAHYSAGKPSQSSAIPLSQQSRVNIPLSKQGNVSSPGVREVPGQRK